MCQMAPEIHLHGVHKIKWPFSGTEIIIVILKSVIPLSDFKFATPAY